ncbi:sodium:proton antiporter [uncultured Rhodococcus sp.]|uniref:cation:proton antiporter n=1 Tax=uncultured Rhodococcus sp. TaxID=194249 RepID=UPI0028DD3F3B|nr:sodium:proton antiporter [uncultured Rhodococcus sp.]
MDALIIVVLGLLGIVAASTLGARIGVAAPLILVMAGIVVSLLPFVPAVDIDPEWILAGVLPPLLYSASVSMPSMEFRREFGAIGGLSVLLVVVSALVLGVFFSWVIPGLGIWWGIALGAIVSPTDAVATSIVKKLPVSPRVVSILEGESLLNDATALVLLRTAIAGAAASVSLWSVLGKFAFAVVVAAVIGVVVGKVNLMVRARVTDSTVNTVISFTVPFLAAIPAEELGASGLVAAVVAGLVTGYDAPRKLSPRHRLSDSQNWRTVELVLEGAIFLVMGLELSSIVDDVRVDHEGIFTAVFVAAGALFLTILVRALYVAPLLRALQARANFRERMKPRLSDIANRLDNPEDYPPGERRSRRRAPSANQMERFKVRVRRTVADIDYYLAAPLGWREGTIVIWAGMRGAVTLAAAQTLPEDTPSRSLLILVAFMVAAGSLILQGGTLKRVVVATGPAAQDLTESELDEHRRLLDLLEDAAASVVPPEGRSKKRIRLDVIDAQRQALLDARDDGVFDARMLGSALAALDADQISLELKGGPDG